MSWRYEEYVFHKIIWLYHLRCHFSGSHHVLVCVLNLIWTLHMVEFSILQSENGWYGQNVHPRQHNCKIKLYPAAYSFSIRPTCYVLLKIKTNCSDAVTLHGITQKKNHKEGANCPVSTALLSSLTPCAKTLLMFVQAELGWSSLICYVFHNPQSCASNKKKKKGKVSIHHGAIWFCGVLTGTLYWVELQRLPGRPSIRSAIIGPWWEVRKLRLWEQVH